VFSDLNPEKSLIVSSTDKGSEYFKEALPSYKYSPIISAKSAGEARRLLLGSEFNLVIINTPLPDEFGHDLALHICESALSSVIIIVKEDLVSELSDKIGEYGVLVLAKPISRTMLVQALNLSHAAYRRMEMMKKETEKLQVKIDEIKMVDRAKCILIERLKMSESQAHRYIEKQAMDMRVTKREVAENILKTHEHKF
jgi:Response regulator with putative antiterminator output domain